MAKKKTKQLHVLETKPVEASYLGGSITVYRLTPSDKPMSQPVIKKVMDTFRNTEVTYVAHGGKVYHLNGQWNGLLWDGKKDLDKLSSCFGELHKLGKNWVLFGDIDKTRALVNAMLQQMESLGFDCTNQAFMDGMYYTQMNSDPSGLLRALIACKVALMDYQCILADNLFGFCDESEKYLRDQGVRAKRRLCEKCWGRGVVSALTVDGMANALAQGKPNSISPCDLCAPVDVPK